MENSRKQNSKRQQRKPKAAKGKFNKVSRGKPSSDHLDMQELNYSVENLSSSSSTNDSDSSGIFSILYDVELLNYIVENFRR